MLTSPQYPNLAAPYQYTTYNECIVVGQCCFTQNTCIQVNTCCFTENTCIEVDYKPSADFRVESDINCDSDCEDCNTCEDCYGTHKDQINQCFYIRRRFDIITEDLDIPLFTTHGSTNVTCTTATLKYKVTHVDTNATITEGTFDVTETTNVSNLSLRGVFYDKCGLVKIEQTVTNCCTSCTIIKYIYLKDYTPKVDFTFTGLCEGNCGDVFDNSCICAEVGVEIKATAQINIPTAFIGTCPCDYDTILGYETLVATNSVTPYVVQPNIIYEYAGADMEFGYYLYTGAAATSYTARWYDDEDIKTDPNFTKVEKPASVNVYNCADFEGRKLKWRIYKKYPEKTILFESDYKRDMNDVLLYTPREQGVYIVSLDYMGCCGTTALLEKEVIVDVKLRLTKQSCNTYSIYSCHVPIQCVKTVYTYNPEVEGGWKLYSTGEYNSLSSNNKVTVPSDGIYKVVLTDIVIEGEEVSTTYTYIIHEYCTIFECMARMIKDMLCVEKCCGNNCDTPEIRKQRADVNRLMAIHQSYISLVDLDTSESFYKITLEESRLPRLQSIQDYLKIMLEVCQKSKDVCNC